MATIMIRHDVRDFDTWKQGYDDAEPIRQAHNIVHATAHRDPENPSTVMAVHQFKTLQDAKRFLEAIKPVMRDAGVVGQPDVWVGEDVT